MLRNAYRTLLRGYRHLPLRLRRRVVRLRLPPEGRAVLYLVEVEGRPYAEAAELLGITEENARARAARARRRLRLDLEGEQ